MAKLTAMAVKNLQPAGKSYLTADEGGLYIRVSPNGKKTWLYIYTFDGKRRWYKLGTYPDMGLKDARSELGNAKQLTDRDKDPADEKVKARQERKAAPTVKELAGEYLERWAKPRKRTWKEDERILNKDVIPKWGKRKAKDIKRRDVILLLDGIAERGAKIQSNRVFAVVRKMFNFAIGRGILDYSPCTQVKPVAKENSKDRCLSFDEIKTFWHGLDHAGMSEEIRRALKLILVTGQRPGEVINLHTGEIDGCWWTIPAEKAKNGKTHRVYLSPLALELIDTSLGGYVFPSPKADERDKPIHPNALPQATRRVLKLDETTGKRELEMDHFTPHDLRRTAASHMTGAGVSRLVVSKILNHAETGVTAIYDRHSYDREKQIAMETWERRLKGMVEPQDCNKVLSFPAG
ncbi:MAG: tyrosine-type recombinase/integrase [Pedobacter sp.]